MTSTNLLSGFTCYYWKRDFNYALSSEGIDLSSEPWKQGTFASIHTTKTTTLLAKVQKKIPETPEDCLPERLDREQRVHEQLSKLTSHVPCLTKSLRYGQNTYVSLMQNTGPNLFPNPPVDFDCYRLETIAKTQLEALAVLHSQGMAHFDLSLSNMTETHLIDFGSCHKVPCSSDPPRTTRRHRAPEGIIGKEMGCAADIWSLATCLFELGFKEIFCPFDDHYFECFEVRPTEDEQFVLLDLYQLYAISNRLWAIDLNAAWVDEELASQTLALLKESFLHYNEPSFFHEPKETPPRKTLLDFKDKEESEHWKNFCDLLDKMFQFNPADRITAAKALKHPFFTGSTHQDLQVTLVTDLNRNVDPDEKTLRIIASKTMTIPVAFLRDKHCIHLSTRDTICKIQLVAKGHIYDQITKSVTEGGTIVILEKELTNEGVA